MHKNQIVKRLNTLNSTCNNHTAYAFTFQRHRCSPLVRFSISSPSCKQKGMAIAIITRHQDLKRLRKTFLKLCIDKEAKKRQRRSLFVFFSGKGVHHFRQRRSLFAFFFRQRRSLFPAKAFTFYFSKTKNIIYHHEIIDKKTGMMLANKLYKFKDLKVDLSIYI